MAVETDFLALYRQLGLSPGCKLADFKQSYRRHVSVLHPDRNDAAGPEEHEHFVRLVAQYNAAMDFHRRHGRLPGAPIGSRSAPADATPPGEPEAPSPLPPRRERVTHTPRPMLLVIVALVVIALIAWGVGPIGTAPEAQTKAPPASAVAEAEAEPTVQAPQLAVGMSPADVRAIEGDPTAVHGDRWEYGPSWVRFERDMLVDWYSSPFRSLKAASVRPRGERD